VRPQQIRLHQIRRAAIVFTLTGALALTACSSKPHWNGPGQQPPTTSSGNGSGGGDSDAAPQAPTISAPANGATGIPAGTQIAYAAADGTTTTVSLTASDGSTVDGAAGYDPSTWVPAKALAYGAQYTAKVTSKAANGKTSEATTTFTTMPKPSQQIRVQSWLGDNQSYGDAVPIVITFDHTVGDNERAGVQKRLTVTTTPAQAGAWSWASAKEIHWRPKELWQPGTKFFVNVQTAGVNMGNGYYGLDDLTVSANITDHPMSIVTNDKTHQMYVSVDGKVVKTIPVSMGKKSTPSSSGKLVIMSRNPSEEFDSSLGTGGTPVNAPGGYKELVYFTMRLTWTGQYIHAAPWSVHSQGHTDVSHGCTNVSNANAQWLYNHSLVGTPVNVINTPVKVAAGNGWTDWNGTWEDFTKGSALPVTS
jgi:lipoprotein-anchoring transpeptidase ErfK/SrfK